MSDEQTSQTTQDIMAALGTDPKETAPVSVGIGDRAPSMGDAPGGENPQGVVEQPIALSELARHIKSEFTRNQEHRRASGIDEMLTSMKRAARGAYSEEEIAQFRAVGARPVYVPVSDAKRRSAMAMLGEIFNNPGDKPWTLSPTPIPDVPESVRARAAEEVFADFKEYVQLRMQEVAVAIQSGNIAPEDAQVALMQAMPSKEEIEKVTWSKVDEMFNAHKQWAGTACERMEKKILDQMVEGGFSEAFNDYVDYVCTYGTGLIKGPLPRMRVRNKAQERNGVRTIKATEEVVLEYEAISPVDCYPSPGARDIDDGNLIVRVKFNPSELRTFSRIKGTLYRGWNSDNVDKLLDAFPQGGPREDTNEDNERSVLNDNATDYRDESCVIEGLEFYGSARGSELLDIGITKANGAAIDPTDYYEVDAILIGDVIVYCRVCERELGRPLCKGVFYQITESWWGESPMKKCADSQKIVNAACRNLVVNMAQAAGPQWAITDASRLSPGETMESRPWKVWSFQAPAFGASQGNPLQMFQPSSNAGELVKVMDRFVKQCDDDSGIPAYTYGNGSVASAGRTASGLSMLTEAATRGIKYVVHQTDVKVIRKMVMRTYAWNMLYDKDETIKGDVICNASGVMGLILKEQEYNRQLQFLQLTNNPTDVELIGLTGRAELLRLILKTLEGVNPDKIIPSEETLRLKQEMADTKQRLALAIQGTQLQAQQQAAEQGQSLDENGSDGMERRAPGRMPAMPQQEEPEMEQGAGINNSARGTISETINNPQERAMQGLRAAAARG